MKLVLQVAGGVFLGIMAVLIVLAIPKWRKQALSKRAESAMDLLTQERLIAKCGKPSADKTDEPWIDRSTNLVHRSRSISYGEDGKGGVTLEFDNDGYYWKMARFSTDFGLTPVDDPVEQVKLLPCLAAK